MNFKRFLAVLLALLMIFATSCGQSAGGPLQTGSTSADVPTISAKIETSAPQAETEATTPTSETSPESTEPEESQPPETAPEATETEAATTEATATEAVTAEPDYYLPEYGGYYYDVENVVLYLEAYGELPPNYITKAEARELGWQGGSVEDYLEGAAIGGDYFGNYEGLLPKANGRKYTECDIDTDGYSSRGSRRLIFSNDGLYFYTSDHYESFREVKVTEDHEVIW